MSLENFLKEVYLFKPLAEAALQWLAKTAVVRPFLGGDTLFREGEAANTLVIVKSGTVKVSKRSASGGTQDLSTLGARAILGDIGFVEREPRSATAEGVESGEIIEISFKTFDEKIAADPAFGVQIYRAVAHELVKTIRRTTNDLTTLREIKLRQRD